MQAQHYQIRATNTSDGQGRVVSDSRPITQQDLRGGEIITAEPISSPTQELHGMQENDIAWRGEGYMSTQDRAIPPIPNNRSRQEDHLGKQQNGGHADTCAHAPPKDIQSKLPRHPTLTDSVRWPLTIQKQKATKAPITHWKQMARVDQQQNDNKRHKRRHVPNDYPGFRSPNQTKTTSTRGLRSLATLRPIPYWTCKDSDGKQQNNDQTDQSHHMSNDPQPLPKKPCHSQHSTRGQKIP